MNALWVTGTGTDVGKTVLSLRLLEEAIRRGVTGSDVAFLKPVQSGTPGDAETVGQRFGARVAVRTFLSLKTPCAPLLAARLEGATARLAPGRWRNAVDAMPRAYDRVVAEGAGGLFSPWKTAGDQFAFVRRTGWPVVLAAPAGLGALHQVLSLWGAAGGRKGLPFLAVVLNAGTKKRVSPLDARVRKENAVFLRRTLGLPVFDLDGEGTARALWTLAEKAKIRRTPEETNV